LLNPGDFAFFSRRLVGLPSFTTFEDLLGSKLAAKGAMKAGASATQPMYPGMSHMGDVKQVTAHHLADGQQLALELQVCLLGRCQSTYI
jgi:hypothetical protein